MLPTSRAAHLAGRRVAGAPPRGTVVRRLGLLLLIAVGVLLPAVGAVAAQGTAAPRVAVVELDGAITPVMARHIDRALGDAAADGATAVVLRIDTPGGLSSAMDDIVRDVLESKVPVLAWVGPRGARAASAGLFVGQAAHVLAMAPGTNIGSASPVGGDGGDLDETMARKVTNDAVAQVRNLAAYRGRNADWAESAVRDAANVTADQAASLGVIDVVAEDIPGLLAAADGRTVQMGDRSALTLRTAGGSTDAIKMSLAERFLQLLADPTVAYLLLSLGSIGLFLELSNPGGYLPGVVGGLSLLLGLFSLGTLPVDWTGVLLILFGLLLLVVDVFVPSFGALTVGGLASFVIGSYLLFGEAAPPGYEISPVAIWAVTGCLVAFFVFLAGSVLRARLRPAATGRQALVGAHGTVRSPLGPAPSNPAEGTAGGIAGQVFLQGELWEARLDPEAPLGGRRSRDEPLPAGAPVVVTGVEGIRLVVRPAEPAEATRRSRPAGTPVDDRMVVPVRGVGTGTAGAGPGGA